MVTGPQGSVLGYDPLGRLASASSSGLGTASQYAYDGDHMLIAYNLNNGIYRRYVFGPGADEPIAYYKSSQSLAVGRQFIMADERGSVISTADSAGTTQGIAAYDEGALPLPLVLPLYPAG
jgi:YD repeat-containing protein